MKRVVIESPFAGKTGADVGANILFARRCLRDALKRGEAPLASHLLYTQPGVLDDLVPTEREWGISAGLVWHDVAELVAFYIDLGWSPGMRRAFIRVREKGIPYEIRKLDGDAVASDDIHAIDASGAFGEQGHA